MKRIWVFLIAALMAGCSPYTSNLTELPGPVPEKFIGAGEEQTFTEPGRFWEEFNDSELNRLVEEALDGNLSIRQALARYDQFSALEKISRSSLLPFLTYAEKAKAGCPVSKALAAVQVISLQAALV